LVTEILVPTDLKFKAGLSVGRWFKHLGDPVSRDEPLVEIDTDSLSREIRASVTGILSNVLVRDGGAVDHSTCSERLPKIGDAISLRLKSRHRTKSSCAGSAISPSNNRLPDRH
jgi:hypothetical protein